MKTSILQKISYVLLLILALQNLNAERNFAFKQNLGQLPQQVIYEANLTCGSVFFEQNRWLFNLGKYDPLLENIMDDFEGHNGHGSPNIFHALDFEFINANTNTSVLSQNKSPWYFNYFKGNNPQNWATNVHEYKTLTYQNIYDGIDLVVFEENDHLKYYYRVAALNSPQQIETKINGAENLILDDGNLIIQTSIGDLIDLVPRAWQIVNGESIDVQVEYLISENVVSFNFPNGYDTTKELIIDPELVFATFSGSTASNYGYCATYDLQENSIGGGIVFDDGYPITTGAIDVTFNGGSRDAAISKFSANEGQLLFSTYLGGSGQDHPHSMIVNAEGNIVIFGSTESTDFPVTSNGFDTSHNGSYDIYTCVISGDGTQIIGATFFGGSSDDGRNSSATNYNYGDPYRGEVNLDSQGNILIASITQSNNLSTSNAYQSNLQGNYDGLAVKFNNDVSELIWATYIGGDDDDAIYNIKEAENGLIYVCGGTEGGIETSENAITTNFSGDIDGFAMALNESATNAVYATYLGDANYNQTYFLDIAYNGDIVVFGQTNNGYNYPPFSSVDQGDNGQTFVQKLTADLSTNIFTTRMGNADFSPTALSIDVCDKIYISGWTDNDNAALPVTADAFMINQNQTDGRDFQFVVFNQDGSLHYGTFFGSEGWEHVDGGTSRFSPNGYIHQGMCTNGDITTSFPVTEGAWSQTNNSSWNLAVVKFFLEPDFVNAQAIANAEGESCGNSTFTFTNAANFPGDYFWDFGDGNFSTEISPTHTYQENGIYNIQLIIFNELACNTSDTSNITLQVNADFSASFEAQLIEPCVSTAVQFVNTTSTEDPIENYSFFWDFGDGNFSEEFSPFYIYADTGQYEITLTVSNDSCLSSYSDNIHLAFNPELELSFNCQTDENGNPNGLAQLFINSSNNTDTVIGGNNFGIYQVGDTITVTAISFGGCEDTESIIIECEPNCQVQADFELPNGSNICGSGTLVIANTSVVSLPWEEYNILWDFGDGTSSTQIEPEPHFYSNIGTYVLSLTITNIDDVTCTSSVNLTVTVAELPTAQIDTPCLGDLSTITGNFDTLITNWGNSNELLLQGDSIITFTAFLGDCMQEFTLEASVIQPPQLTLGYECQVDEDGVNTGYAILSIETNGMITNGVENGMLVLTGETIDVIVENTDGCENQATITIENCEIPCVTELGNMPQSQQLFCETGIASAQIDFANLQNGTSAYYVLHSQVTENEIEGIIATNETGIFDFNEIAGLEYYQTYYISFVAENLACGTLQSIGPPIVWVAPIGVNVVQDCEESSNFYQFDMVFTFTGGLPQYDPTQYFYNVAGTINGLYEYGIPISTLVLDLEPYYVEVSDYTGCQALVQGTFEPCSKTSIELLDFSVKRAEENNVVSWTTASEINNQYFILEHSLNGISFTDLEKINSHGNSSYNQYYRFTHENLVSNHNFYRLKSVDFDGKKWFSEIILIKNNKDDEIYFYPNPVNDLLYVNVQEDDSQKVMVNFYDCSGKLIDSKMLNKLINVKNFPSGLYFYETFYHGERIKGKFFKK